MKDRYMSTEGSALQAEEAKERLRGGSSLGLFKRMLLEQKPGRNGTSQ